MGVEGMDEGVVVGGIVDQELCSQGEARVNPAQQFALNRREVLRLEEVHMIPEALAAQRVRESGYQPGEHRALVPFGESPLALGPRGAVDGCQDQVVPYQQGGPTPLGEREERGR